jgi:hypothetical protein
MSKCLSYFELESARHTVLEVLEYTVQPAAVFSILEYAWLRVYSVGGNKQGLRDQVRYLMPWQIEDVRCSGTGVLIDK